MQIGSGEGQSWSSRFEIGEIDDFQVGFRCSDEEVKELKAN
jgi:hypothetical protein